MSRMSALLALAACSAPTLAPAPEGPASTPVPDPSTTTSAAETPPPTTPPGPPVDGAEVVDFAFPAELACGAEDEGWVTVRNTGTTTWTEADGYKLGAVGDSDELVTGDVRVWLDADDLVAPGAQHTFFVPLTGTLAPATVLTDWQMVHEGVQWFGDRASAGVVVACDESRAPDPAPGEQLPLPDLSWVVDEVAAEHPDWLADSCQEYGGSWAFLDEVVDRLRAEDTRWGYNWKRGVVGDPSMDVVDYHWGPGPDEGSQDVYILDIIGGHCGPTPTPAWNDVTDDTAAGGTIGVWTGRGRF